METKTGGGVGVEKLDKYLRLPVHCGKVKKKLRVMPKLMRGGVVFLRVVFFGFNGNRARCAKL